MDFGKMMMAVSAVALTTGPLPSSGSADARTAYRPPAETLCQINNIQRPVRGNISYSRQGAGGTSKGVRGPASLPSPPPPPSPPPMAPPPPPPSATSSAPAPQAVSAPRPQSGASMPRPPMPGRYFPVLPRSAEKYDGEDVANINAVANTPVSTFSVDVDTGAYANARRFLNQGKMPPADSVRTEEMINYFRYDYPLPKSKSQPFSITTDMAKTPWNKNSRLLRVGLRGYDLDYSERPAANLVFLVDISGSMRSANKLPLVKSSLNMLADQIRPQDRVSIVVYSGATAKLLSPCNKPQIIKQAVGSLTAGGSTAGGQGMKMAYATARANFKPGSVNRIMLATDGDFNVGITDKDELKAYVKKQRESGITLTALGYGTGNYNEALMEQIANVGNGNYAYIDSAMEAQKVLKEEMSSTLFTIAKDVKIQIEFNPAYVSEYRLIGYENRLLAEEDFANDAVDAGDIGASHQVTALYEIVPAGAKGWLPDRRYGPKQSAAVGKKNGELGYIKLRYKLPDGDVSKLIERPLDAGMIGNAATAKGDMAFAVAVAGFGQKLRGDTYLGGFGFTDIRALAGTQDDYWRQEFVKLTQLAESQ